MAILDLLLGRRLANTEGEQAKMTEIQGVPAMGLDGLSSSAYGPEAALAILIPLGAVGLNIVVPVMGAILLLLVLLTLSYWQTIEAYPSNGGSYTVASDNLGLRPGLLAGCALMVDYVLNVAVGISAGIGALTSAVPSLHPYALPLCLAVLMLVTLANLRGTSEAGLAFGVPTFLFVVIWIGLLGWGMMQMLTNGGHPTPVTKPPPLAASSSSLGIWLILRCFASGCTAMTGVEAVSNGVGSFRDPAVKHAHRTLAAIVILLAILLAGIALLCRAYGIGAMDESKPNYQSVLSQLAAAIAGRGPLYDVAIATVLAVVCLSANTSFVGFPRLCRLLAEDDFLPYSFAMPGRRLVFSLGILFLAAAAGILLVAFDGITDALIPLFAVGAFLAFTLSQAGMARHWTRAAPRRGRPKCPCQTRHQPGRRPGDWPLPAGHRRCQVRRGRLDYRRHHPMPVPAAVGHPPPPDDGRGKAEVRPDGPPGAPQSAGGDDSPGELVAAGCQGTALRHASERGHPCSASA